MTHLVADDLAGAFLFLAGEAGNTSPGRSIRSSIFRVTTVVTVPSSSSPASTSSATALGFLPLRFLAVKNNREYTSYILDVRERIGRLSLISIHVLAGRTTARNASRCMDTNDHSLRNKSLRARNKVAHVELL